MYNRSSHMSPDPSPSPSPVPNRPPSKSMAQKVRRACRSQRVRSSLDYTNPSRDVTHVVDATPAYDKHSPMCPCEYADKPHPCEVRTVVLWDDDITIKYYSTCNNWCGFVPGQRCLYCPKDRNLFMSRGVAYCLDHLMDKLAVT